MDVKRVADKYIERGGYMPGERRENVAGDILALLSFIEWHEPDDMWGGYRAREAFDAACRLLMLEAVEMRKIVKGK